MSQRDKLIERICRRRPSEATFSDVCRLLELYGWERKRQESSHCTFTKRGEREIFTVPLVRGKKVKGGYLDRLCSKLGLDD